MPTIQEVLQTAFRHHQAGNLQQAEQLYCQILQVQPDQVDALHLLGLVCQRTGRQQHAVEYIRQALRLKPDYAEAHNNLGIVLRQMGRIDEAIASYQQSLRLKPNNPETLNNLGVAFRELKKLDEAIHCYQKALDLKPNYAEAHNNLGIALTDQDRFDEAVARYKQALVYHPNHAESFNNLGNTLRRQGKLDEALASFHESLRLRPHHADTFYNLGVTLAELGKLDEAIDCYQQALQRKPEHVEAHNNLGVALTELRQLEKARVVLQRAVQLRPHYAEGHNNLGNTLKEMERYTEALDCFQEALRLRPIFPAALINRGATCVELGQLEEAVTSYRQALTLQPESAEALTNLGAALRAQMKPDEAIACYQQALRLQPDYPEALNNLGIALLDQGHVQEAIDCYQQVLRRESDQPETSTHPGAPSPSQESGKKTRAPRARSFFALAHMNRAIAWLLLGDFERGWAEYEWRWQCKEFSKRPFAQPRWDGSSLEGKTILLHAEQGLGDTIQFIRYARLVQARGGKVIFESPRALVALLARCPGIDELVAFGSPLPAFDVHLSLLSLPSIFRTTLETIPNEVPYLFADPALSEQWQKELASISGFKVGIVWQGNPKYKSDRLRSFPLALFAPLAKLPGVTLVSLQKGFGAEQLQALGGQFEVIDLGSRLDEQAGPFMDTAAVLAHLDLVISADTSVAHLAGAMAVPVWLPQTFAPEWRWMRTREDSPWYPTLRLFRQKELGDWSEVFDRMALALQERLKSPPSARSPVRASVPPPAPAKIISVAAPAPPDPAGVQLDAGVALAQQGKLEEAIAAFEEALRLRPGYAEAHFNIGLVRAKQGKSEEAIARYRQALTCNPDYAAAHINLGAVLSKQEKPDEALVCYREALRLQPDSVEANINVGTVLIDQDKFLEAHTYLQKALRLAPNNADVHYNLGTLFSRQGKFDEAIARLQQTLTLRPSHLNAYLNLGNAYLDSGRLDEAARTLLHLLRFRPDDPDAHKNLSMVWLLQGDFERGWEEYEWRWRCSDLKQRSFPQPLWDGSPLRGRTILLHAEQGLGDGIQFIRYVRWIKERGGRVVVECLPALIPLLRSYPGIDLLTPLGSALPVFDVHASLMSLPFIFRTTLQTVPREVPYLFPDPALVEHWKSELAAIKGFKIGIVWQGSRQNKGDRWRSFPLQQFAPVARVPGVRLISLQKGHGAEQLASLGGQFEVIDLGSRLDEKTGPFLDTTAVMKNLDLVISADTATAHLAGALGVPVWVLLAFVPDWRWMLKREDSPWYPTARLFRQQSPGEWAEVFDRIAQALEKSMDIAKQLQPIHAEMAPGELFDKITILEIKNERITEEGKLRNVRIELADLNAARDRAIVSSAQLAELVAELKAVNEALWKIEDDIRDCERNQDFGATFIELARSVYRQNDRRAAVKRRINDLLGSRIIEEKSYQAY